ncbi:hypothetical protein ABTM18_19840, partial [Acinetobacter baumannii]
MDELLSLEAREPHLFDDDRCILFRPSSESTDHTFSVVRERRCAVLFSTFSEHDWRFAKVAAVPLARAGAVEFC